MTHAPGLTMTAADIAAAVGGTLVGRPDATVEGIAPLDRATSGDLSMFASGRYQAMFEASGAGVVLVTPALADAPGPCPARVVVADPQDAMIDLIPRFFRAPQLVPGVHPTAIVSPSARIGAGACIEPYVVIGDDAEIGDRAWIGAHCAVGDGVLIGDDVHLYPHVTLYTGTRLAHRVTVHSGARIGADGYGYVFREGVHRKIPQVGRAIIGNDVEIGANVTIDRGSIDDTVVGDGTKVDNLAQIGHNVRIGRNCLIMSQVGVAGSVRIEDGAMLAGQVGVSGHLTIGRGARLAGQAGVISDVPPGETWSGFPARPHREVLRAAAANFRLTAILKALERLVARNES
jgi:UDP-3-O-[3-hydroxymyristoyl] glucosamine N-acyltransferase